MARWAVRIRGLKEQIVEAGSRDDAIAVYKATMGVVSSVHPFEASRLDADANPVAVPVKRTEPAVQSVPEVVPAALPGTGVPVSELAVNEALREAVAKAGMTTIAELVVYAREHGSVAALDGIGNDGDRELQRAVVTWKHMHKGA